MTALLLTIVIATYLLIGLVAAAPTAFNPWAWRRVLLWPVILMGLIVGWGDA